MFRLLRAVVATTLVVLTLAQNMPNRPPGKLLLNMLIKDERVHLDRTLPKWAKIIDYWVIGVDDKNTDDSVAIINKHLSHIPGAIVIVKFDGMGPTWSELVQYGVDHFPEATHGIIADADFAPMKDTMDKMELDIRCSKHMYTIWTQDHRNERKMDWIYRNIQGAKVKRRTHQIVEVPRLPNQEVFQTLIDLPVDEMEGGYQDRTGSKNTRYIGFLEADLLEYPNDTRSIYYLGYAHFDYYAQAGSNPTEDHKKSLETSIAYFKRRLTITDVGNEEELWFAVMKLAEIYERYKHDWAQAEYYYNMIVTLDPERADGWFYLGQHYRLSGQFDRALPFLMTAARLPIPERSLFMWHHLYTCLSSIELGRLFTQLKHVSKKDLKMGKKLLLRSDCSGAEANLAIELRTLRKTVSNMLKKAKPDKKAIASGGDEDPMEGGKTTKTTETTKKKVTKVAEEEEEAPAKVKKAGKKAEAAIKKAEEEEEEEEMEIKEVSRSSSSSSDSSSGGSNEDVRSYTDVDKLKPVKKVLSFFTKNFAVLEEKMDSTMLTTDVEDLQEEVDEDGKVSLLRLYTHQMEALNAYLRKNKKMDGLKIACKQYRQATSPFLHFNREQGKLLSSTFKGSKLDKKHANLVEELRAVCR